MVRGRIRDIGGQHRRMQSEIGVDHAAGSSPGRPVPAAANLIATKELSVVGHATVRRLLGTGTGPGSVPGLSISNRGTFIRLRTGDACSVDLPPGIFP